MHIYSAHILDIYMSSKKKACLMFKHKLILTHYGGHGLTLK